MDAALVAEVSRPASARSRPGPAAVLAPLSVVIAVAGLVVAGDASDGVTTVDGQRLVLVVSWAGAGAVLASQRPLCRLGRILLAGTFVGAIAFAGATAVAGGWVGAGGQVADGARSLGTTLLVAVALHAMLALPRGELGRGPARALTVAGYVAAAVAGALLWSGASAPAGWAIAGSGVVAAVVGLPLAQRRYLGATAAERQRLQWVGCAAVLTVEVTLVIFALQVLVDWPPSPALAAGWCTLLIPIALAVSTSSRMAAHADRLLASTVAVAGLTAIVVAIYVIVVLGLGRTPEDGERQLLVLSMVAAAVAAVVYLPARDRLADVANRLVYGERQAPDEVLRTFGSRLSRAIPMDELLLQLAESLRKTMQLTRAEVWNGRAERLERSVSVPDQGPAVIALGASEAPIVTRAGVSGRAWAQVWLPALLEGRPEAPLRVAPVSHSGELLGLLLVERPPGSDPFGDEEDMVLAELARQVGLALHNVALDSALQASLDEVRRYARELQASRARIVATADEERRRIERNLHDGAQQHLVALAVSLRLTKDLVADDPETATEMLDELSGEVRATIQELRDLAHGIYPPLLMDSGLPEALPAAAARSPLEVEVDAAVGRHPTEVEAAIYFCCLEAMQNAAKHAPNARVTIQVRVDDGRLCFDVADDGPGFDPATATAGHGYLNMSDRLGAIGGDVRWESTPGTGARVSGSVPVARRAG